MSFRRTLRPFLVALLGIFAAATTHAQQPTVIPTPQIPYSTDSVWPTAILHGDFDGDGKEDLLYQFSGSGAYAGYSLDGIFFNNGQGTFSLPYGNSEFAPGFSLVQTVATLQPGGNATLISLQGIVHQAEIGVVPFTTARAVDNFNAKPSLFPVQGVADANFTVLTAADLNGDGVKDLLAEDAGNNYVYALLNDGNGSFTLKSQYALALADGTGPMLAGDFNGNGKTDFLILGTTSSAITFYHGNGDGTFIPGTQYTLPGGIFSMLVADVDGDNIPDLIVEGANGAISYFPGTATGFSTTALPISGAQDGTTGNGGHLIAIADLNGDHIPDIVTSTPAGISVLLGQGSLTYKLLGIYNAGPGRSSYALADFNGDGHLDLAVDSPEGIAILFGNADGSFQTSHSYAAGQPAYSVAVGQFTNSGNQDAVVATGVPGIQLLNGDGNGGFTMSSPPAPANQTQTSANRGIWSSVVAGDFNGDGKLDAAVVQNGGQTGAIAGALTFALGDGTDAFPSIVSEIETGYPHQGFAAPGDFDGKGSNDVAIFNPHGCGIFSGSHTLNGSQPVTVVDSTSVLSAYNTGATGFLKVNRTDRQDLVCNDSSGIHVYRNNGDGTFTQITTISNTPDTATANSSGVFPATGLFASSVLLADLDGDGNGDVIVVRYDLNPDPTHASTAASSQFDIYWGKGDGTFSSSEAQNTSRNNFLAAVADIDGDGKPDLILSDGYVLTVFSNPRPYALLTEQHYLAGMGINGIATANINGQTALVVANGGAVLSNPAANRGTLSSNTEVNTGGITVLLPRIPIIITATVTAAPSNPGYGRTFTLSTTLTPPSGITPTGTVTFSVDGVAVGTAVNLVNDSASYTVTSPTYTVGTHTLGAAYSGDSSYPAQTFTGSPLTVTLLPSQTNMSNVVTPIYYGQIIGDVAIGTEAPLDPGDTASLLGGTINFFINGSSVCSLPVNGTSQTCPPTTGASYPAGNYTLNSMYSGNQFYSSSSSPNYPVQVLPDVTNPGTLTSSLNPATIGQSVTFTAVFTAPFATPTGAVTFLDGSTIIGTGTLDVTGTAQFTTSVLALGTHTITATYAGNINFDAASSNPLQQTILPTPLGTLTTLQSSSNPSTLGQTVTFTATVIFNPVRLGTPLGSIGFTIDGVDVPGVPSSTQQSASATYSTSTLALGSHNIVASFIAATGTSSPTSNSTSPTLVQVVNAAPPPPTFTLTINPAAIAVPIGNTASVQVTVTPVGGFNQPVTLSCGALPHEATCAFAAGTITGSGTTFLTVSAAAPHTCGTTQPYFITPSGPTTWLGLLGTGSLILLLRRRRRLVKGIILALALCILPALSGCGNCTDLGVEPGNYTFTVTAKSTGTPSAATSQTIQMIAHL